MNEKDLLTGVLTKTLNKTDEEVAALLYKKADDSDEVILIDDALNLILDHDATRVEKLKKSAGTPSKAALKAEYDKGAFGVMKKLEDELRQSYETESEAKGIDLVKEIVHTVSECSKEITENDIKNHPLYLNLEKMRDKDLETLRTEFDSYKSNQDRLSNLDGVKGDALAILPGLKPIESQNADVSQSIRNAFLGEFDQYEYRTDEDGTRLIMKNDKREEDKHGNPIKFMDFVLEKAKRFYEFEAGGDGGNAGNTNDGTQTTHTKVPKTKEEYLAMMAELLLTGDSEGRVKLAKVWEESQSKN